MPRFSGELQGNRGEGNLFWQEDGRHGAAALFHSVAGRGEGPRQSGNPGWPPPTGESRFPDGNPVWCVGVSRPGGCARFPVLAGEGGNACWHRGLSQGRRQPGSKRPSALPCPARCRRSMAAHLICLWNSMPHAGSRRPPYPGTESRQRHATIAEAGGGGRLLGCHYPWGIRPSSAEIIGCGRRVAGDATRFALARAAPAIRGGPTHQEECLQLGATVSDRRSRPALPRSRIRNSLRPCRSQQSVRSR